MSEANSSTIDALTAGMTGPRIHQLREAYAETSGKIQAVRSALLAARPARAMTSEERTNVKAWEQALTDLTEEIGLERRAQDRERAERPTSPNPNTQAQRTAEKQAGVQVGKDLSDDDPKRGFKSPGDFLHAVMDESRGVRRDVRLRPLYQRATAGSDEQGEYSNPFGGYLLPIAFSPTVLQLQPEDDPIASLVRSVPMSSPQVRLNARVDKNHTSSVSGGLTVTRRPETVAASSSRMEFEQITLTASGLFGLSFASEEIITDSPISFIAILTSGFRDEFASHLLNERLNGTGVGEFEGILNSSALITVSKETGQPAATINYDNIKKMRSRVWGYGRAVWIANHDTMPELMSLVQVVGTGGAPVYMPSAQVDRPDVMFGRPIIYTEYAETLGTAGDLICANWNEYLEGVLQPLQSAESMHVRFVEHERAFKFWMRNDGRSWWRSALQPKKSSQTLSPFVVLQTRS